MPEAERLENDLRYVREAVESSHLRRTPPGIYLIWAAICGVGFPLLDVAPERAGLYWLLVAPAGTVASVLLGRRNARRTGQLGRGGGRRHALHWVGLLLACLLALPLASTGRVDGAALGQAILLLVALVYYLAGVHLDPALLPVGGLIALGYLGLFVLTAWGWSLVGLTLAAGLATGAWIARRPRGEAAA